MSDGGCLMPVLDSGYCNHPSAKSESGRSDLPDRREDVIDGFHTGYVWSVLDKL